MPGNGVDIMGIPQRVSIPCQPQVHILGRGEVPESHYGLPDDFQIKGAYHKNFHAASHVPEQEQEKGASRFYQWHFDAALYGIVPPRVGCLLAVRTPKGPDCIVGWEGDEGTEMVVGPGVLLVSNRRSRKHDAFANGITDIAGSRALELVPDDLKDIVKHSSILYAPKSFKWMSTAHATQLGHTLATEGLEIPIEELDFEESKLKRYPMIWTNPVTGE
ncbi:hypothetical protein LTR85_004891 [Meristemomyces frigidus]|nr:hypothetical protein LTR85_004891 [Meristemomyces frigidus]